MVEDGNGNRQRPWSQSITARPGTTRTIRVLLWEIEKRSETPVKDKIEEAKNTSAPPAEPPKPPETPQTFEPIMMVPSSNLPFSDMYQRKGLSDATLAVRDARRDVVAVRGPLLKRLWTAPKDTERPPETTEQTLQAPSRTRDTFMRELGKTGYRHHTQYTPSEPESESQPQAQGPLVVRSLREIRGRYDGARFEHAARVAIARIDRETMSRPTNMSELRRKVAENVVLNELPWGDKAESRQTSAEVQSSFWHRLSGGIAQRPLPAAALGFGTVALLHGAQIATAVAPSTPLEVVATGALAVAAIGVKTAAATVGWRGAFDAVRNKLKGRKKPTEAAQNLTAEQKLAQARKILTEHRAELLINNVNPDDVETALTSDSAVYYKALNEVVQQDIGSLPPPSPPTQMLPEIVASLKKCDRSSAAYDRALEREAKERKLRTRTAGVFGIALVGLLSILPIIGAPSAEDVQKAAVSTPTPIVATVTPEAAPTATSIPTVTPIAASTPAPVATPTAVPTGTPEVKPTPQATPPPGAPAAAPETKKFSDMQPYVFKGPDKYYAAMQRLGYYDPLAVDPRNIPGEFVSSIRGRAEFFLLKHLGILQNESEYDNPNLPEATRKAMSQALTRPTARFAVDEAVRFIQQNNPEKFRLKENNELGAHGEYTSDGHFEYFVWSEPVWNTFYQQFLTPLPQPITP